MAPSRFSWLSFSVFLFAHHNAARGFGFFRLGHEHLRNEDSAGGRHDDGAEHVPRLSAEREIGRHDRAGDVRHAAGHHGHEFGAGEFGQERTNGHRRFRLTHEDAGGNVKRLGSAGAHDAGHRPGRDPDDELHYAVVIENMRKARR